MIAPKPVADRFTVVVELVQKLFDLPGRYRRSKHLAVVQNLVEQLTLIEVLRDQAGHRWRDCSGNFARFLERELKPAQQCVLGW